MGVSSTSVENVTLAAPSSGTIAALRRSPEAEAAIPLWKAVAPVAIAIVLALSPVSA
jgi:hypothetical protein